MSVRTFLLAGMMAACFQAAPVVAGDTATIANDGAEQQFQMPKVIVRPVQRVAAEEAPVAPPPAPPVDYPAVGPPPGPLSPGQLPPAAGHVEPAPVFADDCEAMPGWQGNGAVHGDGYWYGDCGPCNNRTCKEEMKYYWSKFHGPCRSTCDMPPHFPYYPQYHGYYYFRPYNWEHVWMHQALAPMLGESPYTPYATTAFQPIYAELPPEELPDRQTLPLTPGLERGLPSLEYLLREPEEEAPAAP